MTHRRDRLGRKIGRNWWREMNCDLLYGASAAWERERDEACIGYETEELEYAQSRPRPTLKDFLVGNAGMNLST